MTAEIGMRLTLRSFKHKNRKDSIILLIAEGIFLNWASCNCGRLNRSPLKFPEVGGALNKILLQIN